MTIDTACVRRWRRLNHERMDEMKGKWKVSHNYAGGEKLIQVYRQLDVTEPDHAGNREYKPGFFETDEEAQALADSLNTKHWKISYSMLYRNGSVQEAEATIAADTIDQALKMAQPEHHEADASDGRI